MSNSEKFEEIPYPPQQKKADVLLKNEMIPRCMMNQFAAPKEVLEKLDELSRESESLGYKKLGVGVNKENGWFIVNTRDAKKERFLEVVWKQVEDPKD